MTLKRGYEPAYPLVDILQSPRRWLEKGGYEPAYPLVDILQSPWRWLGREVMSRSHWWGFAKVNFLEATLLLSRLV